MPSPSKPPTGVSDYRNNKKKPHVTQDQKKFRILCFLKSGESLPPQKILTKAIETSQNRKKILPPFFLKMIKDSWIEKNQKLEDETGAVEYKIGESGQNLLKTLERLKTIHPENPIFELDVFKNAAQINSVTNPQELEKLKNDLAATLTEKIKKLKISYG